VLQLLMSLVAFVEFSSPASLSRKREALTARAQTHATGCSGPPGGVYKAAEVTSGPPASQAVTHSQPVVQDCPSPRVAACPWLTEEKGDPVCSTGRGPSTQACSLPSHQQAPLSLSFKLV